MRTIILYGNSVAVSSVGACLREREGLRVVNVATGLLDPASGPDELPPDVIIFDVTATQPRFSVELLRSKPGLLLVGVDLANGKALVLSSQTSRVLTTDDLVHVIESHVDTEQQVIASKTDPDSVDQMAEEDDRMSLPASEAHEKADI